jgi:hypothetical protein
MSVNLGPVAFEAIVNLKNNADWRQFVHALDEQMSAFMNKAIDTQAGNDRIDATGYARGLRDLRAHIEMVENPLPGNRVPKPHVKAQHNG